MHFPINSAITATTTAPSQTLKHSDHAIEPRAHRAELRPSKLNRRLRGSWDSTDGPSRRCLRSNGDGGSFCSTGIRAG